MLPESLIEFFATRQELLWILTVVVDLGMTLLMFRVFGKMGLYGVIVMNIIVCNILGPKITVIFGFNTSMGVILYSGIYFATDLLGERYGKREANRAVMIGFAAAVLMILFGTMSVLYTPTADQQKAAMASEMHIALSTLFDFAPRFVFGSLLAYLISQSLDVWTFHYLKEKTKGRHLWLRNNLSTITSQAADTLIYAVVVWTAVYDLQTGLQLAGIKYVFKVVIALVDTPFIYWARHWDVDGQLGYHDEPDREEAKGET